MIATTTPPQAPTYLGPESNGMLMTPEEFDAVDDCEEGYRYELINGIVVVNPPPSIIERSPNDLLGHLIRSYQDFHPNGSCVDETASEQTIRCGRNRRRCDRAIWIGLGRPPDENTDVPQIAIEMPGKRARDRHRDYVVKRQEYADAGVEEYWIVDFHQRRFTVCRSNGDMVVLGPADIYRTDRMPGFELPLERLFGAANRYLEAESRTDA